jgi:Abortive infection C-terminus
MAYELTRPDHLDDGSWAAIESYRRRFADAVAANDRPAVVGAAKDLIECVARCVLDATENPLGDSVKFPKLIYEAQKALKRVAGPDLGVSEEVKAIANAAQTIATSVNAIRNEVGTGHGRARLPGIDDEMTSIVSDATMLWCRWALRRLGHLLAGYPNLLLAEVNTAVGRDNLQRHFDEVRLPHQPPDIQHAIGVAFGRQAAGGFGNAFVVGVKPAAERPDLDEFPVSYRLGLVEGMVIDYGGQIGIIDSYVPELVDVLMPVPSSQGVPAIAELAAKARSATWISYWRGSPVDPAKTVEALHREQQRLGAALQKALDELRAAIDPANRTDT